MNRHKFSGIVIVLLLCCSAPVQADASLTPDQQQAVADTLRTVLSHVMEESGANGASAAIELPGGVILAHATGYADVDKGIAMTPETRLLSASVGKTFVAATAMTLVEDGTLSLDRKISAWLGDEPWFDRLPNHADLTLRVLLNHSSGVPDHIYQSTFRWKRYWRLFWDRDAYFEPAELIGFVLDLEPLAPVGQQYAYGDTNYILIGMVIEKATGNRYYSELQDRILDRLPDSDIVPSNSPDIPNLSKGYVDSFFTIQGNPRTEWTGGGLAATPSALVRFFSALVHGDLVSSQSLDEMISSTVPLPGRTDIAYGLGLFVINNEEFGHYVHHSGWKPGYLTNVIHYVDHDISVALIVNQDYDTDIYGPVKEIARAAISIIQSTPDP